MPQVEESRRETSLGGSAAASLPVRPSPVRRRVMLFTDSFIHGGTERQFVELLRSLNRSKYEVLVGCLKQRGPFLPEVEQLGLPIYEFPITSLYGVRTARYFFQLVKFLREQKIDLVHAFDFYTNVFAIPAARLARVPVVMGSVRELLSMRRPVHRWALKLACKLAHCMVMNSQAARRCLDPSGRRNGEFEIVHNGISAGRYGHAGEAFELRSRCGLSAGDWVVGVVSALRPEKGHRVFLQAAARVAAQEPRARFVLVGDGPERRQLELLVEELGLGGRVLFAGDTPEVAQWLSLLDVFVMPSQAESLSNAVLEAMAAGRAIVATDVGGNAELIEEGRSGCLVPAGNPEAMAGAILRLLRDPALRGSLGEAARACVASEFTTEQMSARTEAIYDRLLHERGRRPKILQIGNYPPPMCGWAMITYHAHRALLERGAEAVVMDIGPDKRVAREGCIPLYGGLDYLRKIISYRARGFTFFIHTNGDTWKGYVLALLAMLLGRLTGKPGFLGFRAGPQQMYFPRSSGFWRWAFKLLFLASGQILCDSEPVKRVIASYVDESKIHAVSPYTVQYEDADLPVALPAEVEQFFAAFSPVIFSYTLFRPEFTMDAVFQAFAALRREFPRAGLLIAGPRETPSEAEEQMQRLGIRDAVFIAGNLAHAEFLTAMQRAAVFLRSHLRDGVCASVLEALRLGVPVVAAEDGIRPPSVITYAPGEAVSLAKTLADVLRDPASARARIQAPEVGDHLTREVELLLAGAEGMRK